VTGAVLVDHGLVETRFSQIAQDEIIDHRLVRHIAQPHYGQYIDVRVTSVFPGERQASGISGPFSIILNAQPGLHPGQKVLGRITRSAWAEPGRMKQAQAIMVDDPEHRLHTAKCSPLAEAQDALRQFVESGDCRVIPRDLHTALWVRKICPSARIMDTDTSWLEAVVAKRDQWEDEAVTGRCAIADGWVTVERTRAMTVMDIDGVGHACALAQRALSEIVRIVRVFDIGGRIAIDIPQLSDRKSRMELGRYFDELVLGAGLKGERSQISGFGLLVWNRPKIRASLQDILCGTELQNLSAESRGCALIGQALRMKPSQTLTLTADAQALRCWPLADQSVLKALESRLHVPVKITTG